MNLASVVYSLLFFHGTCLHNCPQVIFHLRNNQLRIFFLAVIMISFPRAFSQTISANAKLDSSEYLIGDWIKVRLEVKHPQDVPVTWQLSFDSLKGLEVVEIGKADSQKVGNDLIEKRILTLSAFDSGNFVIPPFIFRYKKNEMEEFDSVTTEPLAIAVNTIPVDTSRAIQPIKAPLDTPFSLWEIRYYLLAALLLILIGDFIYFLYATRKKKPEQVIVQHAQKKSAGELALEKLMKLEDEKLWQKGETKLYHSRLTDIVREYMENRFSILALESTTDEILRSFRNIPLKDDTKEIMREILVLADLVKFAKANPLPDENEKSLLWAYQFVKETVEIKSVFPVSDNNPGEK